MKFRAASVKQSLASSPLLRLATAGVFLVLFTLSLRELNSSPQSAPDFESGSAGEEVIVEILSGESGSGIGQKLEMLSVVKSSTAFFRVAVPILDHSA